MNNNNINNNNNNNNNSNNSNNGNNSNNKLDDIIDSYLNDIDTPSSSMIKEQQEILDHLQLRTNEVKEIKEVYVENTTTIITAEEYMKLREYKLENDTLKRENVHLQNNLSNIEINYINLEDKYKRLHNAYLIAKQYRDVAKKAMKDLEDFTIAFMTLRNNFYNKK